MVVRIETLALVFVVVAAVGLVLSRLTARVSARQALLLALSATIGIVIGTAFR
jgi:hypothetical protein